MKTIGVCISLDENDDINKVKLFLESLFKSVNYGMINYYIHLNSIGNYRELTKYLEQLTVTSPFINDDNEKDRHFINLQFSDSNLYESYNKLMKLVKEDYICILPKGLYLNNNWHLNLLNYYTEISASGIISINCGIEKTYYSSVLCDDKMKTILMPTNYILSGLLFMKKSLVHFMGGFDCSLIGYEREEICYRSRANGYVNYYILKDNCIDTLYKHETKDSVSKQMYEESVKSMNKNKIFKKQL